MGQLALALEETDVPDLNNLGTPLAVDFAVFAGPTAEEVATADEVGDVLVLRGDCVVD